MILKADARQNGYHLMDGIEFLRSLPDKSVDGMFTDPPWGKTGARHRSFKKLEGEENWLQLIEMATDECARVFRPGARALIWMGMVHLAATIKAVKALEYRWTIFCLYVPARHVACFESRLDPILFFSRPEDPWPKRTKKQIRQIYQKVSSGKKDSLHPCSRPFRTVKHILRDWFDEEEYVIDPFAGSDTTGVACRCLNLKYDGCEIDPMMYQTGLERNKQVFLFE